MAVKKVGIALPEEILDEIDRLAEDNFSNRSHTIVRIWLEWKAAKAKEVKKDQKDQNTPPTESRLELTLAA